MAFPGHKVFAELGYTYIGGSEGDDLKGFIQYGEHLLVAEPQNIWRLSFKDLDPYNIPHWEPSLFVPGIGCINVQTAVNTRVGLIWLSRNGLINFGQFGPRKISEIRTKGKKVDRLVNFWRSVNWGAAEAWATGLDWSSKKTYLLSVPVNGSERNNIVLVWDYENDALWFWDNLDIQDFVTVDGPLGDERVLYVDSNRVIWELTNDNLDNQVRIPCSLTTQRINQGGSATLRLRECGITSKNTKSGISAHWTRNDDVGVVNSYGYDFSHKLDSVAAQTDVEANLVRVERERNVVKNTRISGETFRCTFTNSERGREFLLRDVFIRGVNIGRRTR
jgi:hypothetical protein